MERFDLNTWAGFKQASGHCSKPAIIDQIAIDSRRIYSNHALFIALKGHSLDGHNFVKKAAEAGAAYALVSKNWKPESVIPHITLLHVEDPLQTFQELAALYRKQRSAKVIGITGSYGKTILKDLLKLLLNSKKCCVSPESFNSQIGVPLSIFQIKESDQIAVIEAGISHPGEMARLSHIIDPNCGIITNIGKAHQNTLKSLEITAQEKIKLLLNATKPEWHLIPTDPLLEPYVSAIRTFVHYWDRPDISMPYVQAIPSSPSPKMPYEVIFPDNTRYQGKMTDGFKYFIELLNIAVRTAWMLQIPSNEISSALDNYTLEPMSSELWRSPEGTTFINDAYCSDPQSVDLALRHFDKIPSHKRKFFVFGGIRDSTEEKDNALKIIGRSIRNAQIDHLTLFGQKEFSPLLDEIKTQIDDSTIKITHFASYSEAIQNLKNFLKPDDIVLIKGAHKQPLDALIKAFNDSINNNQCFVNLAAIQANIEAMKNKLPLQTRMMVMVKALAYGTDDIRIAKFLSSCGIDILGVSYVEEGVALKREGITQSIFVLNAAIYEVAKVVKWELEVGVNDAHMIEALGLEAKNQNKTIKIHLHVDTGMSRFGCRPEETVQLALKIAGTSHLQLEGIMTHFACADQPEEDAFTYSQANCFDNVIKSCEKHGITFQWIHACNSSAVMRFNFHQYNMVRVGLAIYGLYPSEAAKKAMELQPALSLISHVVAINTCKKGETISYGRSYTVNRETERIAVLPIGYFDGLHRNYSGKSCVIIRGRPAPMVGRICMDYMMVDVTDIPDVQAGDPALIFGYDEYGNFSSPEKLADRGSSFIYELITCLGPRIQRVFINQT